jgi:hypothetical protein
LPMTGGQTVAVTVGEAGKVALAIRCYSQCWSAPSLPGSPNLDVLLIQALRFAVDLAETPHPNLAIVRDQHAIHERIRCV